MELLLVIFKYFLIMSGLIGMVTMMLCTTLVIVLIAQGKIKINFNKTGNEECKVIEKIQKQRIIMVGGEMPTCLKGANIMSNQAINSMDSEMSMATDDKLRIMCITDDDAFDFTILENAVIERNRIGESVDLMIKKYKNAKWIIFLNG